jgi:hypothetical protein
MKYVVEYRDTDQKTRTVEVVVLSEKMIPFALRKSDRRFSAVLKQTLVAEHSPTLPKEARA